MSVREISAIANFMLGGGSSTFEISTINDVVAYLNASFGNGTPSQFAKDHLALPCNITPPNHCPVTISSSVTTPLGTSINVQLQASDEDNDALTYSISQNPLHGIATTSSTGAASYTPTAGYYGTDEFKFKASDGKCESEATVTITIVKCPEGKGYWKNNSNNWPAGSTPMLLGTQSYTKGQLLVILNTEVGTGSKADASIILAQQLIAAKLNVANGAATPPPVPDSIAKADLMIGNNRIPMKIKPNTPLGQRMVNNAAFLETYNKGLLTAACQPTTEPLITNKQQNVLAESSQQSIDKLEVKAYPNPSTTSFSVTVQADPKEKIAMQVVDMYGRVIETKNVTSNSSIRFGDRYRPGTYFVRIIQGKEHKEIKLIKLSN
jgi:hypothetical protein